ncbi:MAG TPA: TolC family protein [Caulobacteraceae bacterium]|nr:TolC family protein [Caulobacteraceae bacterium]
MKTVLTLAFTFAAAAAVAQPLTPGSSDTITPPPGLMDALPPDALARAALEDHPDVIAAKARLERARAEEEGYRAGSHEVELQAATGPRDVVRDRTYYEANAQVTRAFRLPGKARLDRETGAIGVKAAADEVDDARHQTGLMLASAWFDWIKAGAETALDDETVRSAASAVTAMQRRVELKDAAALELDLAASALDQARARSAAAQGAWQQATLALSRGFPDLPLPARAPDLQSPAAVPAPPGGWHDAIIARSHEIRIARYKADQQRTIAARARLDELPDPTFGVRLSDEYGGREKTAQLVFSIPFGGRYRQSQTAGAFAMASALEAQASLVERQIDMLAGQDVAAVDSTLAAWRASHDALATTEAATHRMQRAYELGEKDLSELLISNSQLYEARRAEVDARVAAWNAQARLMLDSHALWADRE